MPDRGARSPRQRLTELVEQILAKNSIARAITADDSLTEAGLASIDMVQLMLAVEAEFALEIAPADITPENFRSVATIEALIARMGSAGGSG
jgi:acyl carrier protein